MKQWFQERTGGNIMRAGRTFINYTNPIIRNYYGIKERFVTFLKENNLSLSIDEDENRVSVYDSMGNDLEHMTLKQLARRVKLT